MAENKKRWRFDVKVLERYEFADKIIEDLKKRAGLTIESSHVDKHLRFQKGVLKEKNKDVPVVIVSYGGSGKDLRDFPTPLQTELLPLVFKHWYSVSKDNSEIPLLVLGHSFDEVFLRKMRLLSIAIPDLRLIQFINVYRFASIEDRFNQYAEHISKYLSKEGQIRNEVQDLHSAMVEYLNSGGELDGRKYHVLDCEFPAGEGTIKSEMIDILALERKRRWLTVIELKYERVTNTRLQSVVFQGLDYCNWVEEHKKGLAMLFPEYNIDVRRRTRLILINGPEKFPEFHSEFCKTCMKKDKYQEIELYFTNSTYPITVSLFNKIK